MLRWSASLALGVLLSASVARADPEPWADDDGLGQPNRHEFGDYGVEVGAEYRANWLYVRPVNVAGTQNRNASWIEHRLRLGGTVDYTEKVRLVVSMDALDGTVWGDNGTFGGAPSSLSGTAAAARSPNNARVAVGYQGSGDELDPKNYGYVLEPGKMLELRHAYGEVVTPVGLLRIGRQPAIEGSALLVADGNGRPNRWGYSGSGDIVDRVLFATKPLEGFKAEAERDLSRDNGLFFATFYDRVVTDEVALFGDDVHNAGVGLMYYSPSPVKQTDVKLSGFYAHRWQTEYDTDINIVNLRAIARAGKLSGGAESAFIFGRTREVSESLALINSDPIVRQKVFQYGARAVARWDEPSWSVYLEGDLASGDADPNPGTTLSQLYFTQYNNVGLLLFPRVLAFESARSARAAEELLRRLGAPSYPAERVDSRGSFTDAIALFPQADYRPHPNLLLRGGVLMAWTPWGVVDPVRSLQLRDGARIDDDVINFNGGKPGSYYGTELDGRVSWKYLEHFIFDLEGAVLFPGDALQDQNRQAVHSVLVQGRTTFVF
ncbi:MAG: hypothetical protein OZ921_19485 [Sorangiineae bacterium]|nr:hypothetical protein [Polyangiaceae bacterium]MEB2324707.1 hypothetical protein [Sorangiineae bacterium]